ncbi:MAG: hypothetical protein V2I39_09365 [Erythrobacter sp.]|jgi:UDP-MurNAc hydroxylase|nr:hypothetical protein [Erythrobacter sp.]
MQLQALSHAGLRVKVGGTELLCDPWVTGSCYWRSWWNYPPVPKDLVASLKPDFIYLTHLHWDHFQAPSLRLFPRDTTIVVPYDRYDRMRRDLKAVGFENVIELKNGQRVELAPGLALRSYHINPTVTDSAVVIEAEDMVILNANDAKLAGLPLRQVKAQYPKVDFAFRSHSSANGRVCITVTDDPEVVVDDNEHYLRAFALFMQAVAPRYAVPFASNSCMLHDDVYHLNDLVQTPALVRDHFEDYAARNGLDTELKIMLPGDSWDSESGFDIAPSDWFENKPAHLEAYRQRVAGTLEKQAALEAKVKSPRKAVLGWFRDLVEATPGWLLGDLRGKKVLVVSRSEAEELGYLVDFGAGLVELIEDPERFSDYPIRAEFPALILTQSVRMNMFGHAFISKRPRYFATRETLGALERFIFLLDLREAELLPLGSVLQMRTIKAGLARWREGLLYLQVLLKLRSGKNLPQIEEELLLA